jgi:molybdopterin-guanine dinucleotide biosynthesis protein A
MDTLQAANAYGLSPCDPTIKANLVKALTAYAAAFMKQLDCKVLMFCGEKKMDAAHAAFATPLDTRVRAALDEAFQQGGISVKDFPEEMQFKMLMLIQRNPNSDPPACIIPNRALRNKR